MSDGLWPCNGCDVSMLIAVEYDAVISCSRPKWALSDLLEWDHFNQEFKSIKALTDWLLRASHLMIKNIQIKSMSHFTPVHDALSIDLPGTEILYP